MEWVEWACNPLLSNKNSKRAVFTVLFFYLHHNNSDEKMMKV